MSSLKCSVPSELDRVASFLNYPTGDTPSVLTLARSGFVYAGTDFRVTCPLCRIEIEKLRQDENPLAEHRKRTPNCTLTVPTLNNISSTENFLPKDEDVKQSSSGMLEIFNSAVSRSVRQIRTNESVANAANPTKIDRQNPDYELLRHESNRLNTFHDWPTTANADPSELACEELFYTGICDKVRCAFCRNAMHNWKTEDIPNEEHKKHFPSCPFVQKCDDVNVKIDDGSNKEEEGFAHNSDSMACSLPPYLRPNSLGIPFRNGTTKNISMELFMITPAARAVLEMGFSSQNVRQAVQQQLDETGEPFPNAEVLLEKLLSLGVEISSVPSVVNVNQNSLPENTAPAVRHKHQEASSASSSSRQQKDIIDPIRQENVFSKKHKKRKRKIGGLTTTNSGSTINPNAIASSSQATTTFTTTVTPSATTNSEETAISLERGDSFDLEQQELIEENTRLKEARICKVCLDKEVTTVFLPCGHLICCDNCSPKVKNCPLCRTFIKGTVKTFLS